MIKAKLVVHWISRLDSLDMLPFHNFVNVERHLTVLMISTLQAEPFIHLLDFGVLKEDSA